MSDAARIEPLANTDWDVFAMHDSTSTPGRVTTMAGEEIMRDPDWSGRFETALEQVRSGKVRPLADVLRELDAEDS